MRNNKQAACQLPLIYFKWLLSSQSVAWLDISEASGMLKLAAEHPKEGCGLKKTGKCCCQLLRIQFLPFTGSQSSEQCYQFRHYSVPIPVTKAIPSHEKKVRISREWKKHKLPSPLLRSLWFSLNAIVTWLENTWESYGDSKKHPWLPQSCQCTMQALLAARSSARMYKKFWYTPNFLKP